MVPRDLMRMCVQCGEVFIVEESIFFEDCREACSFCAYCPLHGQRAKNGFCPDLLANEIILLRSPTPPPPVPPPAPMRVQIFEPKIRYRIRRSAIAA